MKTRLGVNIDHVATLRQARGEFYPSVAQAAKLALFSGADQITIHLREDRRHIQDPDVSAVQNVTREHNKLFNLEIGVDDEIIAIAIDTAPDWICIVPEKREEKTTEGGLNLKSDASFSKVEEAVRKIKDKCPDTKISLFVEADQEVLNKCIELGIDAVEIHTGEYAKAHLDGNSVDHYIEKFSSFKDKMESKGIGYHAGHGLTDESLKNLVAQNIFSEYNIGHWIVSDSVFNGLEKSIQKLVNILES